MKNKFLRLIACLLVAATLLSITIVPMFGAENTEDPAQTTDSAPADAPAENAEDAPDAAATDENQEGEPADAPADGEEPAEGEPAEGEPADDAPADEPADEAEEDSKDEDEDEDEPAKFVSDEEELAKSEFVCENDNYALYLDREFERIGLLVKKTGFIHWSNCVNAMLDDATSKPALKQNRMSNIAVKYGNATDLITSSFLYSYRQSTQKENTEFEIEDNGVKITYNLKDSKSVVPVHFELEDDHLRVYVKTSEIKEKAGYKEGVDAEEASSDVLILTDISILPYMSAASAGEEGYMFIPDGSGAVIDLNNGKSVYKNYSEYLYGRDITKVRELEADAVEQAYMPVMAMVRGNNGLVMIADKGDTFATVNAAVANNKGDQCGYNYCYFSFVLRSSDDYHMAGDSATIMVFEKGDGKIPVDEVSVRYYPVTSDEEIVPYSTIADVYRDYLIEEKGLTKKTTANYAPLFIDYYGGTLKSKSILGIPIDIKTSYTSFEQAMEITSKLREGGVGDMVVNYNDWTNDSMSAKIDTADSVAGCLGGKSDFKKMMQFYKENNVDFYASVDGFTFKSGGNGFITLFDTAYRVSKSYSRQYDYNIAYGTPNPGVAPALLAPKSIPKLTKKVSKNISKLDLPGVGLGSIASTVWSDFSNKNHTNRATTAQYIIDYYKSAKESTTDKKVVAEAPNAYLLPYVDTITGLPLQSSQFKIVDRDIPFLQMVLHGYTNFSTEAINGSPDSKKLFLKAIASGSNIKYDFIYNEATKLVNTDYVDLYYATYEGWLEQCAGEYKLANEVLSQVSDSVITDYRIDGSVITTTYDNGVKTTVDIETGKITVGGKTYNYSDYVDEGGLK